jgi:hypothetical protein
MFRACSTNDELKCIQDIGGETQKRALQRPRRRWVDNIKIDLREIGCGRMEWIHLAQDRDLWRASVNTETKFRVP